MRFSSRFEDFLGGRNLFLCKCKCSLSQDELRLVWVLRLQRRKKRLALILLFSLEQQEAFVDCNCDGLLPRELVVQSFLRRHIDALERVEEALSAGAERDEVVAPDGENRH